MNFKIEDITGKILEKNKVVGTGFLITPNLFITARHNVHNNIDGEPDEKEVFINLAKIGNIKGKTINLKNSYLKRMDIVAIKLENSITALFIVSCRIFHSLSESSSVLHWMVSGILIAVLRYSKSGASGEHWRSCSM
mgnify:CR=1 FL=1